MFFYKLSAFENLLTVQKPGRTTDPRSKDGWYAGTFTNIFELISYRNILFYWLVITDRVELRGVVNIPSPTFGDQQGFFN